MQGAHFGIGFVGSIPTGSYPTPMQFGLLKDISLDWERKYVEENGQWQYPVVVGGGQASLKGKVGSVSIFGGATGQIMSTTPATGINLGIPGEISTVPAPSGPYTVTVTNSATWVADYGVLDLSTGLWMTRASTATGTGVYAVSAGVYTFNSADASKKVSIAYTYSSAAVGKTNAVVNAAMGIATGYQLFLCSPISGGKIFGVTIYSAFFPKMSLALKPDGFVANNIDFFATEDGTTGKKVFDIYTGE